MSVNDANGSRGSALLATPAADSFAQESALTIFGPRSVHEEREIDYI